MGKFRPRAKGNPSPLRNSRSPSPRRKQRTPSAGRQASPQRKKSPSSRRQASPQRKKSPSSRRQKQRTASPRRKFPSAKRGSSPRRKKNTIASFSNGKGNGRLVRKNVRGKSPRRKSPRKNANFKGRKNVRGKSPRRKSPRQRRSKSPKIKGPKWSPNAEPQTPKEAKQYLNGWVVQFAGNAKKLTAQDGKLKKLKYQNGQRDAEIEELKNLIKMANVEKNSPKAEPKKYRKPKKAVQWKKTYETEKKRQQEECLKRSKNYEALLFEQLKLEQKAADYRMKNLQAQKDSEALKRQIDLEKLKAQIGPDIQPE